MAGYPRNLRTQDMIGSGFWRCRSIAMRLLERRPGGYRLERTGGVEGCPSRRLAFGNSLGRGFGRGGCGRVGLKGWFGSLN